MLYLFPEELAVGFDPTVTFLPQICVPDDEHVFEFVCVKVSDKLQQQLRLNSILILKKTFLYLEEEGRRDEFGVDEGGHAVDADDQFDELHSVLLGHLLVENVLQDEEDHARAYEELAQVHAVREVQQDAENLYDLVSSDHVHLLVLYSSDDESDKSHV